MIQLKVTNPDILLYGIPTTETAGAAGYDLRACIEEPITILSDTMVKVPTGMAIYIEDRGVAGMIMPRSGLAANFNLTLQNSVGLIDSDYQGELQVLLRNEGREPYKVNPGDRIAQLVFVPVIHPMVSVVSSFEPTDRGSGGFGSTGYASRDLATATQYEPPSPTGRELPTQNLGNDSPIHLGEVISVAELYPPTGQELFEAEYGDE